VVVTIFSGTFFGTCVFGKMCSNIIYV
jgi:hypothetical protein